MAANLAALSANLAHTVIDHQLGLDVWRSHVERWQTRRCDHDRLFAPTPARASFVQPRGLAARFERLRAFAGVPDAALHRLRHTVAVILVADGKLLAARHRLGHRDLSTTPGHYGWAQAPDDAAVADHLDMVLGGQFRGRW